MEDLAVDVLVVVKVDMAAAVIDGGTTEVSLLVASVVDVGVILTVDIVALGVVVVVVAVF